MSKFLSHESQELTRRDTYSKEYNLVIGDDMVFPKASVDPKLVFLQKNATEFVTSVILKHEKEFYQLVSKNFANRLDEIIGTTTPTIIQMIQPTTNKFFNDLYFDIQNKRETPLSIWIIKMTENVGYGPHILLDKLIRLTIDVHIDIVREKLDLKEEKFEQSVINQINAHILTHNFLHQLSPSAEDNGTFVNIPEGKLPFNIIIDKMIGK